MHNPANICSPEFYINKNFAVKTLKGFDESRKEFNQNIVSRFHETFQKNYNNNAKLEKKYYLDASFLARLKKRKSIHKKEKYFFNDYRNLSLILISTFLNKKSTCFITSDIDVFCDFYTWLDSMAHQLTFKEKILTFLKEDGKKNLFKNKKLISYINFSDFKESCDGLLGDFLSDDWKGDGFEFVIKYWDPKREEFYSDKLKFNNSIADLILANHGLFYCPYASNHTHGNFIRYLYWPPGSLYDINTIKVSVQLKKYVNTRDAKVKTKIHEKYCRNVDMEKNGQHKFLFQSFRISG
jgi:hypothetical protein